MQREIYGLVEAEQDRARSAVARPLDTDDGTGYGPNADGMITLTSGSGTSRGLQPS